MKYTVGHRLTDHISGLKLTTHERHEGTFPLFSVTYTLACWKLQRARETGLPSTRRKRMEEEGKERKEKPGVILPSKNKKVDTEGKE